MQTENRTARRAHRPVAAGVLIAAALISSPFAVAATGGALKEGVRNGTTVKETEIIGKIGAKSGKGGYVTRQSNNATGPTAGGSAVYGCRAPVGGTLAGSAPCLRGSNLAGGYAFEFSSASGTTGFISVGDPKVPNPGKPFTTNATGVASGLNADLIDGKSATDFLGKAEKAADSDKLDGKDSADYVAKSEILQGLVRGGAPANVSVVRSRGITGASSPGTGRYVVTFDRDITGCFPQVSLSDATGAVGSPGEVSLDQPTGNSVEVNTYNSAGTAANTFATDGFSIQVSC